MCKFCNYNEDGREMVDEDIIDERIRIGNISDALGMEVYINNDDDGDPCLIGDIFLPSGGDNVFETSTKIKNCPMCGRKL